MRRLEIDGIIRGYSAHLAPASLGLDVVAFVSLTIDREQFKNVRDLEKVIRDFPEILECYTISGDFDYLLKVVATDLRSFSAFLTDRLMQVPGVVAPALDDLPGGSQAFQPAAPAAFSLMPWAVRKYRPA